MLTLGVDLAAEPAKTAVARVAWSGHGAVVEEVVLGVDDARIVGLAADTDRIGIDSPFGWPDAFVDLISAHHRHGPPTLSGLDVRGARTPLTRRLTDREVHRRTGIVPLSVSADLIGHVAVRCVGIQHALGIIDRVNGYAVEAYPAAALRAWGLRHRGYKARGDGARLSELVDALLAAAPWLALGPVEALCRANDDAFDAVVVALIARAAAVGGTSLPSPTDWPVAAREGWVHVPVVDLSALPG